MNKEYLPFFNSLEQKYKDIYMEWSKEQLIDHLVANIKNGEVLLNRIEQAIEYMEEAINSDSFTELPSGKITDIPYCIVAFEDLLEILKGKEDENIGSD